jgi:hypothetical protein
MSNRDFYIIYHNSKQQPDGSYIDHNGRTIWFNEEGEPHRDNGPAVIHKSGVLGWRLNGINYSFNAWCVAANIPDEQKLLLRLQYE